MGVNNIVFGYENDSAYKTNYKEEFDKKESNHNRVKPGDLKKNNIDFGDTLTDFTTTYARVFETKNAPLQLNNKNTPQDGRKSHLMLGNDQATF